MGSTLNNIQVILLNIYKDYVESISKMQENNIMEIMNLHGQTVKRAEISELKQSIDISELKAGIYFVRSGNYTERLIIR